jgi:hypothetical protein
MIRGETVGECDCRSQIEGAAVRAELLEEQWRRSESASADQNLDLAPDLGPYRIHQTSDARNTKEHRCGDAQYSG